MDQNNDKGKESQGGRPYKVFIANLPPASNYDSVRKFVAKKVSVTKFKVFKSKRKGKNKNSYAIITVFNQSDFDKLLNCDFKQLGEQTKVREYLSTEEKEKVLQNKKKRRVYLNELELDIEEGDIRTSLSQFGEIEQIYLKNIEDKDFIFQKKYAFVTFKNYEGSLNCYESRLNIKIRGQPVKIHNSNEVENILIQHAKLKEEFSSKHKKSAESHESLKKSYSTSNSEAENNYQGIKHFSRDCLKNSNKFMRGLHHNYNLPEVGRPSWIQSQPHN